MALFGKGIANLSELFVDELKNIYYMENEIVENLPEMIEVATSADLKRALSAHLTETRTQVARLEKIFEICDLPLESGACPAIDAPSTRRARARRTSRTRMSWTRPSSPPHSRSSITRFPSTARSSPGRRS